MAQQNPKAIDAGVFHNDVIAVGNQNVFLFHESAFVGQAQVIEEIGKKVLESCDTEMIFIEIPETAIPLSEAVSSYFFNSQLVSLSDDVMALMAPSECRDWPSIQKSIEDILKDNRNPINQVHYFNLRESMRNGGGPACLRLRVVLNEAELQAVHPDVFLTDILHKKLTLWIQKHYRDRLKPEDLSDPQLLREVREALDELTKILNLGAIYPFQKL